MQSNNILQAIRDKRLILALYERVQYFKIEIKKEYKEYLRKKSVRELITLVTLFLVFFCGLFSVYIQSLSNILMIVFSVLMLIGSFLAAIIANVGLSKIITFLYNQKIISQYNVKFNSVNQDRLGINLIRNPLFYAKLNKLERELESEELYYINNFNFFSNKRTKEGLLLNIYLKAIQKSNFEILEENFDYISNEIKQTFKPEDQKILIGTIQNIISTNKKLILNKQKEESVEDENIEKEELNNIVESNTIVEDENILKEKNKEEIEEEEKIKFLKSLDIDDLIPQQKF